jgi:hypothetical protein
MLSVEQVMKETWKPIQGYEGRYCISDHGRVFSCQINYVMCPGRTPKGYHIICLIDGNGESRYHQIHRLVLEHFVGPCPDGMECCHGDGNKRNNRVTNLRWDTHLNNMLDYYLSVPKEHRPSRLRWTLDDRTKARQLRSQGYSVRQLMSHFNVSRATLFRLLGPRQKCA